MKYHVIADENTVKGFSLFGTEGTVISEKFSAQAQTEAKAEAELQAEAAFQAEVAFQAEAAFSKVLEDKKVGAVIISKAVANLIQPQIDAHIKSGKFPQVMIL